MRASQRIDTWTRIPVAIFAALTLQCGPSDPSPKVPAAAQQPESKREPSASDGKKQAFVGAEFGGMNESEVSSAFSKTYPLLDACLQDGSQGMPYLAGSIHFYLEVDSAGSVVQAYVDKSDLGDRSIAKCMLDVLRKKTWPAPVGGARGIIQSGMTFSPSPDATQPTPWEAQRVATAVGDLADPIEKCKAGATGPFTATAYIGTILQKPDPESAEAKQEPEQGPVEIGKIMAVGVTPPSKEGEEAVDCIVHVLRSGTYPSPGERPAKVTFPL